ncbi:hypothetical protein FM107_13785 [Sphingobacterium sp. JB170]|nr:hypothetical protein FM107_13785 [Sphingobacterium sp. JB170]
MNNVIHLGISNGNINLAELQHFFQKSSIDIPISTPAYASALFTD